MYFTVASLRVLTAHDTECVCHAELKNYLLTKSWLVINK